MEIEAPFDGLLLSTRTSRRKSFDSCCKKCLQAGKVAEFESDLLKNNEDIVLQSREFFTGVCFVGWGGVGGGAFLFPYHANVT